MAGLAGKAVLITGAAGGIGAAAAAELVRRGARVAITDLNAAGLDEVAGRLGDGVWQAPADVTVQEELSAAVQKASTWAGRLDAVVVNAAINEISRIEVLGASDFDRVVAVNLGGAVRTVLAALPHLRRTQGYLLLVGSGAGLVQGPYQAAYNASKAGLHAFGNTIRQELVEEGVAVGIAYFNAVATEAARAAMSHPLMTPLGVERMMAPRSVQEAAVAITEAVARRSRTVYVPRQARLAAAQPALLQRFIDRWVARRLQRAAHG